MGSWQVDASWIGLGMRSSGEIGLVFYGLSLVIIIWSMAYQRSMSAAVRASKPSAPSWNWYRINALGRGVDIFLSLRVHLRLDMARRYSS